jgi:hypothetical protein
MQTARIAGGWAGFPEPEGPNLELRRALWKLALKAASRHFVSRFRPAITARRPGKGSHGR